MPVYEYECLGCGELREIMQKMSEGPLKTCPSCGGSLRKLISNTSFVLKGSGWYVTDYASPERKKAMESETSKKGGNGKEAASGASSKAETPA